MARPVVNEAEFDLEEFMPSEDSQISAALARAITDSEDEGGSLTASTTPLTFSKEPSITGDDGMYLLCLPPSELVDILFLPLSSIRPPVCLSVWNFIEELTNTGQHAERRNHTLGYVFF